MSVEQAEILSETSHGHIYQHAMPTNVSIGSGNSATHFLRPSASRPNWSSPVQTRLQQQGVSTMGAQRVHGFQSGAFSSAQRLPPISTIRKQNSSGSIRQYSTMSDMPTLNPHLLRPSSPNNTAHYMGSTMGSVNGRQASHTPSIGHESYTMGGSTYTANGQKILSEYTTERFLNNQKKIFVEETYDEIVVIPHKKMVEKLVDDPLCVRQRIVEVEVPQYVERTVEVPQIEYVDVEVPQYETVYMDNVIMQPKIQTVERIVEVPKIIYEEKIVEVPTIEYREVEHETIVEVPTQQIETKIVPKYIPQYVEIDVPEIVDVTVEEEVIKNVPLPMEHDIYVTLKFPKLSPVYKKKEVPVYVPRFVDIPVPMDKLDDETFLRAQEANNLVEALHSHDGPVSLAQMESAVRHIISQDWQQVLTNLDSSDNNPWQSNFLASQIPVLLDAVVEVTEAIQNLGLSQSGAEAKESNNAASLEKDASLEPQDSMLEPQGSLTRSADDCQMSVMEPHVVQQVSTRPNRCTDTD